MSHILYIEDDPDAIIFVKKFLESHGYKVIWGFTGKEGLDLALAHPGLILLDIKLPDMSGYDVVRQLRAFSHSHLAYVPIIAITAYDTKQAARNALEAGCDVSMTKPVDMRELRKHVESYLPALDNQLGNKDE